jgi:hypothetical protein
MYDVHSLAGLSASDGCPRAIRTEFQKLQIGAYAPAATTGRPLWRECGGVRDCQRRNYESEQNVSHGRSLVPRKSKDAWRNDDPNSHCERYLDLPFSFGRQ